MESIPSQTHGANTLFVEQKILLKHGENLRPWHGYNLRNRTNTRPWDENCLKKVWWILVRGTNTLSKRWGGYSSMERILSSENGENIFLWTIAPSKEYPLETMGLMLSAEQIPCHKRVGNTCCGVNRSYSTNSSRTPPAGGHNTTVWMCWFKFPVVFYLMLLHLLQVPFCGSSMSCWTIHECDLTLCGDF